MGARPGTTSRGRCSKAFAQKMKTFFEKHPLSGNGLPFQENFSNFRAKKLCAQIPTWLRTAMVGESWVVFAQ